MAWSQSEREDIVALWRYIAYVLGAPDELLRHAMANAATALRYTKAFYAMDHPPDDTNRLMLRSLMEYASKNGLGYDPLPDWLSRRLSGDRRKALTYGFMYAWSPEHIRLSMEIPRNPYRYALKVIKPALVLRERFGKRSAEADERACMQMLENFAVVTRYGKDEAPLADPDEIASDIQTRTDRLRAIFSRG